MQKFLIILTLLITSQGLLYGSTLDSVVISVLQKRIITEAEKAMFDMEVEMHGYDINLTGAKGIEMSNNRLIYMLRIVDLDINEGVVNFSITPFGLSEQIFTFNHKPLPS